MASNIKVIYIGYGKIGKISENLLNKHNLGENLPIDIEYLLDNIFRINIIPFPNLLRDFNINAFTSSDLKKIYIDEHLYLNLVHQYRFTLGHELGHIVLHKYFYKQFEIKDIGSYIDFLNSVDDTEYGYLEYQAHCFGGHFLVPSNHLEPQFNKHSKNIIDFVKKSFKGVERKNYIELAVNIIAKKMSPAFNLHPRPIQIRIFKSGLARQIP